MRDEFNVIMENVSSMMQYNKDECDRMYRLMKVTEERKNFDRKVKALSGFESDDYKIYGSSNKIREIIEKYKFKVCSFGLEREPDCDGGYVLLERYECTYGDWVFDIVDCATSEKDDFCISELQNIKTNERIDFFWSSLYGAQRGFDLFVELLEYKSEEDFVKSKYRYLYELQNKLKQKGYDVNVEEIEIGLKKVKLLLDLGDNCYIQIFSSAKYEDISAYIYKEDGYEKDPRYEIVYNDEGDFVKLCKCIESFYEHISGQIGFFENGRYYNGDNIGEFMASFVQSDVNENLYGSDGEFVYDINNLFIDEFEVNKYMGVEINTLIRLIITGDSYSPVIDTVKSNENFVRIVYDSKKSNLCRLNIRSYIIPQYEDVRYCVDDINVSTNEEYNIGSTSFEGSYLETMEYLKDFFVRLFRAAKIPLDENLIKIQ